MGPCALRVLVTTASLIQIGFGAWHFFVPRLWSWYTYIDRGATELVLAIQAINLFFSLCLVLLGAQNMLLVFREPPGSYGLRVALGVSTLLWSARVAMQLALPQGSMSAILQYGLLACFVGVAGAYGAAWVCSLRAG